MSAGVYSIISKIDGRVYVGSSAKSIEVRWLAHKSLLRRSRHHNFKLQLAWIEHGEENFIFSIIENCSPLECVAAEQRWIDSLRPDYNLCEKAGSRLGVKHSTETLAKMAGRPGPKHTNEHRLRMSRILTGRKFSPETIEKMRAAARRRTYSEETRRKISASLMGNKRSLGVIATLEARENMRQAQLRRYPKNICK